MQIEAPNTIITDNASHFISLKSKKFVPNARLESYTPPYNILKAIGKLRYIEKNALSKLKENGARTFLEYYGHIKQQFLLLQTQPIFL